MSTSYTYSTFATYKSNRKKLDLYNKKKSEEKAGIRFELSLLDRKADRLIKQYGSCHEEIRSNRSILIEASHKRKIKDKVDTSKQEQQTHQASYLAGSSSIPSQSRKKFKSNNPSHNSDSEENQESTKNE